MAKIKPYKIEGAEPTAAAEAIDTTATTTELAVPTAAPLSLMGEVSGEVSQTDIVIPRLNLCQSVGPLSELFNPGEIVLNKEVVLSDGTTPVELTVLSLHKQWEEDIPYGSGERPSVYDTEAEVQAAGGTTIKRGNQKPTHKPIAHAYVLIKAPENVVGDFPFEFKGARYALCVWSMRGAAFYSAGRALITASAFSLRDGLFNGAWSLTTRKEKFPMGSVYVPVLRSNGRHRDPEFTDFIKSLG